MLLDPEKFGGTSGKALIAKIPNFGGTGCGKNATPEPTTNGCVWIVIEMLLVPRERITFGEKVRAAAGNPVKRTILQTTVRN